MDLIVSRNFIQMLIADIQHSKLTNRAKWDKNR